MAKKPDDRFQSAKDVLRELTRLQKGLSSGAGSATSAHPPVPHFNLGGSQTSAQFSIPNPVSAQPPWWGRARLALFALGALGLGLWLSGLVPTAPDAHRPAPPTAPIEFRPSQPLASRGELALQEKLRAAVPGSREAIRYQFDLGLLRVEERRFEDAEKAFKELEKSNGRADAWPVPRSTLIKLGLAISESAQDHWKESIKLFEDALAGVARGKGFAPFEKLCFDHPEIGRAIADAVTRNAENKPKDAIISPAVDSLRSPSSLLRGPGK